MARIRYRSFVVFIMFLGFIAAYPVFTEGAAKQAEVSAVNPESALMNVYGRNTVDLSGPWRYLIDPTRAGLNKPGGSIRNFVRDLKPDGNKLIEYEFDTAPQITVPGDWNTQVPELTWYDGLVWYRKTFDAAPQPGKRYFLYFEAVNYFARVHLNGNRIGEHSGGFTPFAFEVTELLKSGDNSLVVAVDGTRSEHTIPAIDFDWRHYTGITRPVHLVETPDTYIHDYQVWLERQKERLVIHAKAKVSGKQSNRQKVTFKIPTLNLTLSGITDSNGRVNFISEAKNIALWSPQNPHLYQVSFQTKRDQISDEIGLRTIEVKGEDILLNGESIYIKGISLHEETLGNTPNRTLDWQSAEALLNEAKALGCNFVRLAHYPHSEKMTRLADRMGLLVWSEIPLWQKINFNSPSTLQLARDMLRENIDRDRNRASIVFWSVANETPITEERTEFLKSLIEYAKASDPTRLVSAAMDKSTVDGNTIVVEDPLGQYMDVLAVNQYEAWYGKRTPDQVSRIRWKTIYDKPMIFSEFGAGALHGYRADKNVRWSEDYQRYLYEETLKMAEQVDFLRGISPWILKDFRSPRRYHTRYQNGWNRKGLISPTGERKLAYKTLQQWYQQKQ